MADNTDKNQGIVTNTFTKGMVKDYNDTFLGEGLWTHARNAVNNSHDGQLGVIGNEPSNLLCITLPYTYIGGIHLTDDKWAVFSTDDTNSEIGLFDESDCSYRKLVNDPCLNFKRSNLITGTSRKRFDCNRLIYWDDGINPSRLLNIDDIPFKYKESIVDSCTIKTKIVPEQLDCEKIRLAPLIITPKINLKKGSFGGTLPNGSYQACLAYTIDGVRMTDYLGISEVQSVFSHDNVNSSLEIEILSIDNNFDEFELVILSNINQQTTAKKIGHYSTSQGIITLDRWSNEFETVPVGQVVFRSQPVEKSDAMYVVNNYLLRVGVNSKFKFNYQKQANNIKTLWSAVRYPADYYAKGGNNTGYLRDEQYAFFIRWIYNTGDRSESYHIPGRKATAYDLTPVYGDDVYEAAEGLSRQRWQVENTATIESNLEYTLPDGGRVVAEGLMGYWESSEKYPDDKIEIWGDLCGKPIRHNKFPDASISEKLNHFTTGGTDIVIMGVKFENITHPLDNNGKPIESIIGYEILRGSREGNKSIVAKGMLNNLREYNIPGSETVKGLYQNYPYNDLRPDEYLIDSDRLMIKGGDNDKANPLTDVRRDMFSFHSPETTFSNPFINAEELKIYSEISGNATGKFEVPYKHPRFKLLNNNAGSIALKIGLAIGITTALGKGNVSFGGTAKSPIKADLAGGKMNLPAVGGALGVGTTAVNAGIIVAQAALDIVILISTSFLMADNIIKIMNSISSLQQYALQYVSKSEYTSYVPKIFGERRRKITNSAYIKNTVNQFTTTHRVNNLNRAGFVALELNTILKDPAVQDNSRVLVDSDQSPKKLFQEFSTTVSSHYGALKINSASQYGQLYSIKQVIASSFYHSSEPVLNKKFSSGVIFGGDTYINKFTEKNTMFFFTDWLFDEVDEIEYDYRNYPGIAYPRFFVDSTQETFQDLDLRLRFQSPLTLKPPFIRPPVALDITLAQTKRSLNRLGKDGKIEVKNAYFYLFNSGVRQFFVESEINLAHRDWEEEIGKRHYDDKTFTDLSLMFRSDYIKSGNFYKYDYSLSVSKLVTNSISWGNILYRDYDPLSAEKCYIYSPNKVVYSLPQQDESRKDNWRIFLPNNYKEFSSPVTAIKSVNKTGALFMMKQMSPLQFMGVEELKLEATGAKITIGDGGLFTGPQQLQSITNAEESFEYGSNQGRYNSINTVHGVFWISQNQGKIFQYAGSIKEISKDGMKWWFAKYLPSELLKVYTDYPLYDNPVIGVGTQIMYDNINEILYICKKDYKPKRKDLQYDDKGFYLYKNGVKSYCSFQDKEFFESASWTISYDPKSQTWISFHDWIPTFLIPGRAHFMSVNTNSIWKHNIVCNSYCKYYGVDYPFDIEFVSATGQQVNSMRNIEYMLEVYEMSNDCRDKFHVLDANFDQAMIYNSEQISGLLKLELKPKNNPLALLTYPIIEPNSIRIHYSKEENKYRFNQFWDITNNRGEFASTSQSMFITKPNGFEFEIDPLYVNYNKSATQRKKFRHNINKVWLRKYVSGSQKFLFKISNQKTLQSLR